MNLLTNNGYAHDKYYQISFFNIETKYCTSITNVPSCFNIEIKLNANFLYSYYEQIHLKL